MIPLISCSYIGPLGRSSDKRTSCSMPASVNKNSVGVSASQFGRQTPRSTAQRANTVIATGRKRFFCVVGFGGLETVYLLNASNISAALWYRFFVLYSHAFLMIRIKPVLALGMGGTASPLMRFSKASDCASLSMTIDGSDGKKGIRLPLSILYITMPRE